MSDESDQRPPSGSKLRPAFSITPSPAAASTASNSSGVTKRSQRWVPRGSQRRTYSAPTMARAKLCRCGSGSSPRTGRPAPPACRPDGRRGPHRPRAPPLPVPAPRRRSRRPRPDPPPGRPDSRWRGRPLRMQARHVHISGGGIDARDLGAHAGERLTEQTAAAAKSSTFRPLSGRRPRPSRPNRRTRTSRRKPRRTGLMACSGAIGPFASHHSSPSASNRAISAASIVVLSVIWGSFGEWLLPEGWGARLAVSRETLDD